MVDGKPAAHADRCRWHLFMRKGYPAYEKLIQFARSCDRRYASDNVDNPPVEHCHEPEDIVGNVIEDFVAGKLPLPHSEDKLVPFLKGVIKNMMRRSYRNSYRHTNLCEDIRLVRDQRPDPLRLAEQAETRTQLRGALEKLPDKRRQTVTLHALEGWSIREVAGELGVKAKTAWAHNYSGFKQLRDLLSEFTPGSKTTNAKEKNSA